MAITEADVRLYASQRMTDNTDGGGGITGTVIVDGQDNNTFPDVTDIDRLQGRVNARKIFGAVLSNDTDTYLSAFALLDDGADDTAIDACILTYGGLGTERAALATALSVAPFDEVADADCTFTGGTDVITVGTSYAVGTRLSLEVGGIRYLRTVIAIPAAGSNQLDATLPGSGSVTAHVRRFTQRAAAALRAFGVGTTAGLTSNGTSTITVDRVWARVVPAVLNAAYPSAGNAAWLVDPSYYASTHGQVLAFESGDLLLLSHTQSMSPATVSNGQTVDTGRTNLARLRVIGNNGVEHARFTLGVPAPSGVGCTANLAAGTVTFTDVSGMSQPVTVEHRIEQLVGCTDVRIGSGRLALNAALGRDFPAGTKVSSLLMLGDLQARVKQGFAQQAWTSVWQDTLIGSPILAQFNQALNPITVTNKGAVTERWACIFTTSSSYRLVGETLGEVGVGSTGADFSPSNPVTSVPYLTIPAAGWGTGWAAGNVFRFNTVGTPVPLWELRSIAPSSPGGTDSVTCALRGYVNA